jgi:SAM-dependent methyltransferase
MTAIDFSSVAVDYMQKALPNFRDRIIFGNFFTHDLGRAAFDVVYERTFLCSLPPRLWNDYVARVAELLKPGGLLAGFFFYGEEPDPPPFPLTESKASALFDARFDLRTSEAVTDSLSIFAGQEKWQERQTRRR